MQSIGTAIVNAVETDISTLNADFPTISFPDIQIPTIPECLLQFQFDGLELYIELDTNLTGGATYTLPLYKSKSIIGINLGQEFDLGVTFSVDLILSVEGEIDIRSGFHILLKDGIALNLPMFSEEVSDITL